MFSRLNHSFGIVNPSECEKDLTKKLVRSGKILKVMDYLIIT